MDQFTLAERIFRAAVMAFPGAAVGLIAGLVGADERGRHRKTQVLSCRSYWSALLLEWCQDSA